MDAVRFSTAFTAFWNIATPTCEHFVRKLNLSFCDRFATPMRISLTKDRAFIAEFGFYLFVVKRWPKKYGAGEPEQIAEQLAGKRLLRLGGEPITEISPAQRNEAREIANRLSLFFKPDEKNIVPSPLIPGCGFINHSEADMIFGSTLYEVKTVDRQFRSNDVRQLLMYCALNALAGVASITKIGAVNPRRGIYFQLDADLVSREISGKPSSELFEDIHQVISGGGISR